jgi:dTDP-4-amino-4,6-dideoxygalactose transaminase
LRAWSNFGFSAARTSDIQGTNAKMSEVNAAYGLYSLQNKDLEKKEWLKSQEFVSAHANDKSWITFVNYSPQFHPYWIASFKNEQEKKVIAEMLTQEGIQSREWWSRPLSEQKAFSRSQLTSQDRVARKLSSVHLGLPMYRDLTQDSVSTICDVIQSGLNKLNTHSMNRT